jgi:hypothetical protein
MLAEYLAISVASLYEIHQFENRSTRWLVMVLLTLCRLAAPTP